MENTEQALISYLRPDGKFDLNKLVGSTFELTDEEKEDILRSAGFEEIIRVGVALIDWLQHTSSVIRKFKKAVFGRRSEKIKQGRLFDETEEEKKILETLRLTEGDIEEATTTVKEHSRRKPKKKSKYLMERMKKIKETTIEVDDVPEGVKTQSMPPKVSERLLFIPAVLGKEKIIREQCKEVEPDENGRTIVHTAPNPPGVLGRARVDVHYLVNIMMDHFLNNQPFYHMERINLYMGWDISRDRMNRWCYSAVERYFSPMIPLMDADFQNLFYVFEDETVTLCLENARTPGAKHNSTIVVGCTPPIKDARVKMARFEYRDDKKQEFVARLVGKDYEGYFSTDGYPPNIYIDKLVKVNCHMHARRAFIEALESMPQYKAFSKLESLEERRKFLKNCHSPAFVQLTEIITDYGKLYHHEKVMREAGFDFEQIRTGRQKVSLEVIDHMENLIDELKEGAPQIQCIQQACNYYIKRRESLRLFLDDGMLFLDNGEAERIVKYWIGFRNPTLFNTTRDGAITCCKAMTVLVSSILNGLNPISYMTHVFETLMVYDDPSQIPEDVLRSLLPYSQELPLELYVHPEWRSDRDLVPERFRKEQD